jgi:hypothetical protein
MSSSQNNYSQTPTNQVEEVMPDVLRCFVDWIQSQEPNEQKAHRILRALGRESYRKIDYRQNQRCFTAKDIAAAAGELTTKDPTKWLNWPKTELYWKARERSVIDLALNRGLKFYPRPKRNSTQGGPGNEATYQIVAEPIPENGSQPESVVLSTDGGPIQYEVSQPGEVKITWFARPIFRRGELWLSGWGRWLALGGMFGTIMGVVLLIFAIYFSLISPRPVTTKELALIIAMIGIPTWVWFEVVCPWFRLFDDRIKPASSLVLALGEKDAQVEVLRENDLRVVRFVRYSSTCSICGATVYLDDGSPDFPRRMVGRCSESPREHIFSFDRVTRMGRVLRGP